YPALPPRPPTSTLFPYTTLFRSELANRALAGLPTGGASVADINAGVDAINRGFDACRVLVDCTTGIVLQDSFNDGFNNRPPLGRSEEHTSELQSRFDLVCRLLLE